MTISGRDKSLPYKYPSYFVELNEPIMADIEPNEEAT
jgi:hypothetical protein